MNIFQSLIMTFSLFSRIPMPHINWTPQSMRYTLAGLPLVGVVIGLVVALWCQICFHFSFGTILCAAGITLIPIIVSGGIHLDGFCDVVDAQSSHAAIDKKREILKDPHVGAFAIIGVVTYLIAYFALATELTVNYRVIVMLGCIYTITRAEGGFAAVSFQKTSTSSMLAAEQEGSNKHVCALILASVLVAVIVLLIACNWFIGICMTVASLIPFAGLHWYANKNFGGMSGDIAGWFIQVEEILMLATLVFCQMVVM